MEGHVWDWPNAVYQRAQRGSLSGLPVREVACANCHSTKREHLTWNGRVLQRTYDLEDDYIENARRLDDDMHERRYAYRRRLIADALHPSKSEVAGKVTPIRNGTAA